MSLEKQTVLSFARTHRDTLVRYSFNSLMQGNVLHLSNRGPLQPRVRAGGQVTAFVTEEAVSTGATRMGKMLLAGFFIGALTFFVGKFIQDDFNSRTLHGVEEIVPVSAPAPALTPVPSAPMTTYAEQLVPAAVRQSPVSPLDVKLLQTVPAPAADAQKYPDAADANCIGAKLALSLCTSTE